jgi:hypothetical protein
MASTTRRHWFGGSGNDYAASLAGSQLSVVARPEARLWVYTAAEGGSRITDLQNDSGVGIDELITDASGNIPRFKARVGDTQVWLASADGEGSRTLAMATDLDQDVAANEAAIADIEVGAVNPGETVNGQRFWGYYTNFAALPTEDVEDGDFAVVITE